MPKNSQEYDRKYRLRNKEKYLAYERERYKRRTGKSIKEVAEVEMPSLPTRSCMVSFCDRPGIPFQVEGLTGYLCDKHLKEQTK